MNWINITNKISFTDIIWDDAILSGSSSIAFKITDLAGNDSSSTGTTAYILDTTAPMMLSAEVSEDGFSIVITYSENITGTIEASDWAFDGSSSTINGAAIGTSIDANKVTLSLDTAIDDSEVLTNLVYTANNGTFDSIKDIAGNSAITQTLTTVTNSSTIDATIVVFNLVADESSNHSGRVFDAGETYNIYIIIGRDELDHANNGSGLFWQGDWEGASGLGADDVIKIVYDDGSPIENYSWYPVAAVDGEADFVSAGGYGTALIYDNSMPSSTALPTAGGGTYTYTYNFEVYVYNIAGEESWILRDLVASQTSGG